MPKFQADPEMIAAVRAARHFAFREVGAALYAPAPDDRAMHFMTREEEQELDDRFSYTISMSDDEDDDFY
jgi:hypothetical protein